MPNLSGTKWGGGPLGTAGGVVTWSLAPAGSDVSLFNTSTSTSVSSDGFFPFDVQAAISQAFADWSSHGNIEFIQTEDPGGAAGAVRNPDIRIFFGPIAGNTVGLAFFPSNFSSSAAGDILLDTSSSFVMNPENFNGLALHEIGHSLGLDHVSSNSVLTPSLTATSLQPDDVLGIQQVYGEQDNEAAVYNLSTFERDINILESLENLTINGNNSDNRIDATSAAESILGRFGNDELIGRGGNDTLDGGEGDDTLDGGADNDTLIGGIGADELNGGSGIDTVDYSASVAALTMTSSTQVSGGHANGDVLISIENIIGTQFSDTLRGNGNSNQLFGNVGADTLIGGAGHDTLDSGEGTDLLIGGSGNDVLRGGNNSDIYIVGAGDLVTDDGSVGFDRAQINDAAGVQLDLTGWSGIERVNGFTGDDVIDASSASQNYVFFGDAGADTLIGGTGDDILIGGAGNDSLVGGNGNDTLLGNAGDDTFDGGEGDDVLFVGDSGDFVFDGGAGFDRAVINNAAGLTISVGAWSGVERINGFTGNDVIDATGATSDYIIAANAGSDTIIGGDGNDTFFAGSGDDSLSGANGNDALIGGDGENTLVGGAGNDFLLGGGGADTFVFENAFGSDVIRDYADSVDTLDFSNHSGVNSLADLNISQNGLNTIITLSNADPDQITLVNVTATDLDAGDFIFS